LRLGRRAARADEALRAYVEGLRASLAPLVGDDSFECDAEPLRSVPMEALLRILEAEVARIGDAAPRLDRLESLTAQVEAAIAKGEPFRASLAGTLVSVTPSGRLLVIKAPPRRQKPAERSPEA
jgi:tRNA(Ile)-lysidine synthase